MYGAKKSPVKVVHWDAPVNEDELNDGSDSSNENTNETNIVVSIKSSPSKRSSAAPRKKRRPSSTTQMLEDELKAEAKRRTSSVIDEANLALMVSSLRRQNEDLKAKLQSSNGGGESSIIDKRIMEQKEIECTELKKSVGNLKRLLNIEIDERKAQETQTLELLEDVKKKWHGRDDKRQQQLRKDLKDANQVVVDMELELQRNQSDLDSAKNDIESLQTVKQSLKAKLKECKGKLEATVVNYDAKAELVSRLEQRITEVEAEVKATSKNDRDKKRRASIVISDNRAELETVREDMDRLAAQKRDLEDDLSQLRLEAKTYSKRLESLQQDYEAHLARCDSRLLDLTSENSKLREENDGLENRVMTLEAKLEAKARALEKLEDVQSELEKKIPSKDSLDAYAEKKTNDKNAAIQKENEELSNDLRYAKIEVRLAEKRQKESEDRVKIFRDLYTEQKKKAKKVEDEDNGVQDQVAKLEREKEAEKREKEALSERNETLKTRLDGLRKEVDSLRSEANSQKDLEDELTEVKDKLAKARKQLDGLHGVDKNFEQVKQVCLELEDQTKAYELVIEKLETTLEKLKKSNAELKTKADDATAEMIKAKRDVNELKSTQAFKETKLKDLEEKNKEIEKFYETEGATWKTRYEETTKFKKEQSSTIVEMKDHLHRLEAEQEKAIEDNERLYEQNVKLKEEMTTLITSFHSLKESHLTLQNTVQDLDTKMTESEKELERRAQKIAKLQGVKAELVMKTHEHVETLNQLKKLTQHMPSNAPTPKKKDKHLNPFLL